MAVFEKDSLYPGTYHLPDGRKVTYSPADVRHLSQRAEEMINSGLQIPVAWEHQDDAVPLSEAERRAHRAKFNLGHVAGARLSPEGYLTTRVEVPVDEDAKRLPAVRFVSPEIRRDWTDGNGRLWPGLSITHLAVTPRPVQHHQKPFRSVGLSLVRLSLADVRLGDKPVADEDEEKPFKKKDEGEEKAEEESSDEPVESETITDNSGMMKKVLICLKDMGMILGDGVTPDNLLERLYVAAETKKAAENPGMGTEEPVEAQEPGGYGGGVIAMSLEDQVKSLRRELAETKFKTRRDSLAGRIDGILRTGRVGRDIAKHLRAELDKVQLSHDGKDSLAIDRVQAKVEAYEALPPSASWPAESRLSQATEAEDDSDPAREAEKIGDEWAAEIKARRGKK